MNSENSTSQETTSLEVTPFAETTPDREPVPIKQAVGDHVEIKGVVIDVQYDEITIEISDGMSNNAHRVTLNSNQAAAALK